MTDERNWVLARAACTLGDMFETLTKQMERDIKSFNSLSSGIRDDRLFGSEPARNYVFEVFPAHCDPDDG